MERQQLRSTEDQRSEEFNALLKRPSPPEGRADGQRNAKKARIDNPSSASSDDEEDSEEEEEKTFKDRWFNDDEPFIFNQKHDGFLIDSSIGGYIQRAPNMNYGSIHLFARDLTTYRKGSIVTKRCGPYGAFDVFANDSFIVKKKFFNSARQVELVLLKKKDSLSQFLLVKPDLFRGWTDDAALQAYLDYHVSL